VARVVRRVVHGRRVGEAGKKHQSESEEKGYDGNRTDILRGAGLNLGRYGCGHAVLQLPLAIPCRPSRKDTARARNSARRSVLPGIPARSGKIIRWQVSWLTGPCSTPPSRPRIGQWLVGCRSPLTVAGAATASVPIGYASPSSHLIRRVARLGETIQTNLSDIGPRSQDLLRRLRRGQGRVVRP